MLRLYDNGERELVVAESRESATDYWNTAAGPDAISPADWEEIDQDRRVTILMDPPNNPVEKTAAEWCAEFASHAPCQICTTDW